MTPKNPKTPDFKVSTQYYQVEAGYDFADGLGTEENYFWKTAKEREEVSEPQLLTEEYADWNISDV